MDNSTIATITTRIDSETASLIDRIAEMADVTRDQAASVIFAIRVLAKDDEDHVLAPPDERQVQAAERARTPRKVRQVSVAGTPLLHSIESVCEQLSMGRSWLYAEISAGNIKVAKLGRRTLIPDSELRRIMGGAAPGGEP